MNNWDYAFTLLVLMAGERISITKLYYVIIHFGGLDVPIPKGHFDPGLSLLTNVCQKSCMRIKT